MLMTKRKDVLTLKITQWWFTTTMSKIKYYYANKDDNEEKDVFDELTLK